MAVWLYEVCCPNRPHMTRTMRAHALDRRKAARIRMSEGGCMAVWLYEAPPRTPQQPHRKARTMSEGGCRLYGCMLVPAHTTGESDTQMILDQRQRRVWTRL